MTNKEAPDITTRKADLRKTLLRKWRTEAAFDFSDSKVSIPGFRGSDEAAKRLEAEPVFTKARILLSSLDDALLPLRCRALAAQKTLVGFARDGAGILTLLILDPAMIPLTHHERAASRSGFPTFARRAAVSDLPSPGLVVCASLAVDASGGRLGDGTGAFDVAYATLRELGKLSVKTPIATLVHRLQVQDGGVPMTRMDAPVDLIVTPENRLLTHSNHPRPARFGDAAGGL